jgi:hypothetical protein
MEQKLFRCRVEKKVTKHAVMANEFPLGELVVFVQCLSCGVMGVNELADACG